MTSASPGRDLEAMVRELDVAEPTDNESLQASAHSFDQIAQTLSEALSKAQG